MKWILICVVLVLQFHGALSGYDQCGDKTFSFTKLAFDGQSLYFAGESCFCRCNKSATCDTKNAQCAHIENERGSIMVFLPFNKTLLICGTGKSGTCEIRTLNGNDLSSFTPFEKVVATDNRDHRTIAFIGSAIRGNQNKTVLYTASYHRNDNNSSSLLSIRSLEKGDVFSTLSEIELTSNVTVRDRYATLFDPIAGFSHGGFAYFFANQMNVYDQPLRAKIIRLCERDPGTDKLFTYMDALIECNDFKFLVDVMLAPGNNDAFICTFKENSTSETFMMCEFPFERLNLNFRIAHHSNKSSYLVTENPDSCRRDRNHLGRTLRENTLCDRNMECRNLIAGDSYILNQPNPFFFGNDTYLSAAASNINGSRHTIVLIATGSGNILKIHLEENTIFGRLPVSDGTVQAMKIIDDFVYILNSTGLSRHKLYHDENCTNYQNRSSCLNQTDPFCGWCVKQKICSVWKGCKDSWLPISSDLTDTNFALTDFTPEIGPVSGGTLLTFTGESVEKIEESDVKVFIGKEKCKRIKISNDTVLSCLTPASSTQQELNVSYIFVGEEKVLGTFTYMEDPTLSGISPNRSFASGGRSLTVSGSNFDVIQNPQLKIVGENISEGCDHTTNNTMIICKAPKATKELKDKLENQIKTIGDNRRSVADMSTPQCSNQNLDVLCVDVEFKMDGVNSSLLRQTLEIVRDPVFYNFTGDGIKEYYAGSREIIIEGDRINIAADVGDFHITIGDEVCQVLSGTLTRHQVHCLPPEERPEIVDILSEHPEVDVRVGNIYRRVGYLRYHQDYYMYLYIALGVLCVMVLVLIVLGVLLRRRSQFAVKKLQNDMVEMELRIQTEFRQAFADLQTDMTDITGELVETGLPYNKFPVYAFQILFPADDVTFMTSHKIFRYPETSLEVTDVDTAMSELDSLFSNKFFVLSVISTLEQQTKMSMSEKSSFAAFLAAVLLQDLNYFSQLTKLLLEQFVTEAVAKRKHKSLFRRCESITEKLTSIWLEIALHQHILKHRGGSALIMLVKAMQTVMEKSPIDAVTDAARATLSYDQLLLSQVDNDNTITLTAQINGGEIESPCAVLQCDTIPQVKAKCLGVMYKKDPASFRPKTAEVDLQWHCGQQGRLILQEEDTCPADDNHVKLMTLADYHVTDGSVMELLSKKPTDDDEEHYENYKNIQDHLSNSDVRLLVEDDDEDPADLKKETEGEEVVKYHLVKPQAESQEKSKVLPEAHLHKLLQTKMNIKQFVDELVDSALDKKDIPVVVKYLFSVLEDLATAHGVDQDTLLSWKNNSYPIRFWGLLISRPRIVFDIDTPDYLQPSLDIVASTFIDSFSPPQTLSKNSAPHKLLFFKDLEEYRSMVKSFHRGVGNVPSVDDRDLAHEMHKLSYMQTFKTNKTSVFYEIFQVLGKFKEEVVSGLEDDKDASRLSLAEKFEHVVDLMDS